MTFKRARDLHAGFAVLLRELREARSWSQARLASRVSERRISPPMLGSTISRLESLDPEQRRLPSHQMVVLLADALELEDVERFKFFATAGFFETIPNDDEIERIVDQLEMWV